MADGEGLSVLDYVVLSLQPQDSLLTGANLTACLQQFVPGDYLGTDKVFLDV